MKPNYIAGEWVTSADARSNINPSNTADVIGMYAQADTVQVEAAVAAARAALPGVASGSIQARADSLERIAAEILVS